jgi:hypothetical protein
LFWRHRKCFWQNTSEIVLDFQNTFEESVLLRQNTFESVLLQQNTFEIYLLGKFIHIGEKLLQCYIQKSFLVIGDYKKIWNHTKTFFLLRPQYCPLLFPPNPVSSFKKKGLFCGQTVDRLHPEVSFC